MPVVIPDSLIAVQAYVMWEDAGKPQGGDFGAPARNLIEEKLRSGQTLQQIEAELTSHGKEQQKPAKQQQQQQQPVQQQQKQKPVQQQQQAAAPVKQEPAPQAQQQQKAAQPPPVEVGKSLGTATRNPLQMIKVGGFGGGWVRGGDEGAFGLSLEQQTMGQVHAQPPCLAHPAFALTPCSTQLQKTAAPTLSEDKRAKQIKPLDFLVQRAAGA